MIKGTVVFKLASVGSKSEGVYPFLSLEDGKLVKIALKGDNPFENTALKAYDGKTVALEGDFNENGKFIATAVEEIVEAAEEAVVEAVVEAVAEVVEEVEETEAVEDTEAVEETEAPEE